MRIAVLLSAGLHPVSRRPILPPLEAQAIGLARVLGSEIIGLHAGPDTRGVSAALGHGLARLIHIEIGPDEDPLPSLVAELRALAPDITLAGRRAQGGEDSGLLPYLVARDLGREIVADAAALAVEGGMLVVDQALPRGARRRIRVPCPAVVTVHSAAPAARPYAFAQERRGIIDRQPGIAAPHRGEIAVTERPARPRPKLIGGTGGSAAERLRAATETANVGGEVLLDPEPEAAARAILAHLRRLGAMQ
jgi:electron transfer flavoprotein beta subunit